MYKRYKCTLFLAASLQEIVICMNYNAVCYRNMEFLPFPRWRLSVIFLQRMSFCCIRYIKRETLLRYIIESKEPYL